MVNVFHEVLKPFGSFFAKLRGYIDLWLSKSFRYNFVIEDMSIVPGEVYRTKLKYVPLSCYRPTYEYACNLNDSFVCKEFKPAHSRIIIALSTLESSLDFSKKEHIKIYLDFVERCLNSLERERV